MALAPKPPPRLMAPTPTFGQEVGDAEREADLKLPELPSHWLLPCSGPTNGSKVEARSTWSITAPRLQEIQGRERRKAQPS
jgi:hypothetical protein